MAKEVGVSEEFSCRWWNVALVDEVKEGVYVVVDSFVVLLD